MKKTMWIWVFLSCVAVSVVINLIAGISIPDTKRGEGYIVCLDAGHGGEDPGAVALGREEADDTLHMTLLVAEYLRKEGCTVVLTRSDDTYLTLSERAAIANQKGAHAMVSIHRNMQETDAAANGAEAWVHSAMPSNAVMMSQCILNRIGKTHTMDVSRGVRGGTAGNAYDNYQINTEAVMASCILELGFISNESDNRYYDRKDGKIAKAIANGILDYLEQDETLTVR